MWGTNEIRNYLFSFQLLYIRTFFFTVGSEHLGSDICMEYVYMCILYIYNTLLCMYNTSSTYGANEKRKTWDYMEHGQCIILKNKFSFYFITAIYEIIFF